MLTSLAEGVYWAGRTVTERRVDMDKKSRSPRAPQISLQEALIKVKAVYEKEHTHKANREVIATDMGYRGLSGSSATAIASLRQFGLLEGAGESMRVSDDATVILELPAGEPERVAAIKRAAFAPPLFAELNDVFGSKLPSDENLRLYLVKKGFNRDTANNLIRTYRDTLSLVKDEAQGYDDDANTDLASIDTPSHMSSLSPNVPLQRTLPPMGLAVTEDMNYRLTDSCRVRVLFEGTVTQEAIARFIDYLELGKDAYPKATPGETKEEGG